MPTPLLYAPNGAVIAVELTPDEKQVALVMKQRNLLLLSFGIMSGIMKEAGELQKLAEAEGQSMSGYVQLVCSTIIDTVGVEAIRARFPGLDVQQSEPETETGGAEMKKAAEAVAEAPLGPRPVDIQEPDQ